MFRNVASQTGDHDNMVNVGSTTLTNDSSIGFNSRSAACHIQTRFSQLSI